MINKKNLLSQPPIELGVRDAIHTAIASVRAGRPIQPGERCTLNDDREAVPDENGEGVANPFRKTGVARGQMLWMLVEEVPSVRHEWEHPTLDFTPPDKAAEKNKYLARHADQLKVSYDELTEACAYVAHREVPARYPRQISVDDLDVLLDGLDSGDMWYEWTCESGHEFEDYGTACCPETEYPACQIFKATA